MVFQILSIADFSQFLSNYSGTKKGTEQQRHKEVSDKTTELCLRCLVLI